MDQILFICIINLGIRNALLESEENECPDCHGKEISPETLIPNRYLRNAVNGFKDKTGYSKRIEAEKEKTSSMDRTPIPSVNTEPTKDGKFNKFSKYFNFNSYSLFILYSTFFFFYSLFYHYFNFFFFKNLQIIKVLFLSS